MAENLLPLEQLAFTTVRIQCKTSTGNVSIGTGFIFSFEFNDNQRVSVIITNRHVIKGSTEGRFTLTRANVDGTPQIGKSNDIVVDNFEEQWVPHPKPDVDLCIMPLAPLLHEAGKEGKSFFAIAQKSLWTRAPTAVARLVGTRGLRRTCSDFCGIAFFL